MPNYKACSQLLTLTLCCKAHQEDKRSNQVVQAQCRKQFNWHVLTALSFAVSHTAVLQCTCLYLSLHFYEAPRKKYKPHVGKILPILSSWTDLRVIGKTSLTHTASLKQHVCTALNFSILYNTSQLCSQCTLPTHPLLKEKEPVTPVSKCQ